MTSPTTSAPLGFQERLLHETASTNGELDPSPGFLSPITVTPLLEIVQVSMTDINHSPSVLNPKLACTNEPEDVNRVIRQKKKKKENMCVFQVSRPYLGFCPDPKHFIVNCEQSVVKFAGKWGKMY